MLIHTDKKTNDLEVEILGKRVHQVRVSRRILTTCLHYVT